jgi:hypothetical protein
MYQASGTNKDNAAEALHDAIKSLIKKVTDDNWFKKNNPGAWWAATIHLNPDSDGDIEWRYTAQGEAARPAPAALAALTAFTAAAVQAGGAHEGNWVITCTERFESHGVAHGDDVQAVIEDALLQAEQAALPTKCPKDTCRNKTVAILGLRKFSAQRFPQAHEKSLT